MDTPLLFLGGAGLPAWIWDGVRAELPADSVVGTYPKRPDAHLEHYAAAVLEQAPEGGFTIVAHSIGGVVATQLAATAPDRVAGILGITASFPAPGTSFLAALPAPQRILMRLILRVAGTRPPEKAIRSGLCAGLDEATTTRIVTEFAPESSHLYRDTVPPRTLPGHTGYVITTADTQLPVPLQRTHATELSARFRREIPTGHLPMLQAPAELATTIKEFRAEFH